MGPGTIHVVHGSTVAGLLLHSGICEPASILVQHDDLSCGPLRSYASVDEWREERQRFWEQISYPDKVPDFLERPHELLAHVDRLAAARELILWAGCGLSDQLFLASTVHIADQVGAGAIPTHVVQFAQASGSRPPVTHLDMLDAEQIRGGFSPIELAPTSRTELLHAWEAATYPTPDLLLAAAAEHVTTNLVLRQALTKLLSRYPDLASGLNEIDMSLLVATASEAPRAAYIIGQALGNRAGNLDRVGDSYLFHRLLRLGATSLAHPAVSVSGDCGSYRDCKISLTSVGLDLIRHKTNFVDTGPA